jgi:hypothetical protein
MSDFIKRPLKELGSKAIQDAIEKAISESAGEEYDAYVTSIDFEADKYSSIYDIVDIKLRLKKQVKREENNA